MQAERTKQFKPKRAWKACKLQEQDRPMHQIHQHVIVEHLVLICRMVEEGMKSKKRWSIAELLVAEAITSIASKASQDDHRDHISHIDMSTT